MYILKKNILINISADVVGDGRKLARNLPVNLYDPKLELTNRSLTEKISNAFKEKTVKQPIDQIRLNAILDYVKSQTSTNIACVRTSLSNKIKEITTHFSK